MARDAAHALKGAARSMCAVGVGQIAADMQDRLDENDLDAARALQPTLTPALAALRAAVQALAKTTRWTEQADLPDENELPAFLRAQPTEDEVLCDKAAAPALLSEGVRGVVQDLSVPMFGEAEVLLQRTFAM